MNLKEVAGYLRITPEEVKSLITVGMALPVSGTITKLQATEIKGEFDISDEQLDAFQSAFDKEEPGRRPPTATMRKLRVEATHCCGICRKSAPLQFHHMLEWSKVKHYDPAIMMAICGACHDRIRVGEIDYKAQLQYKRQLRQASTSIASLDAQFQSLIATSKITPLFTEIIQLLSDELETDTESGHTFEMIDIPTKNIINSLSPEYFDLMLEEDDIHLSKIDAFLKNPNNSKLKEKYIAVTSDFKRRLAIYSDSGIGFDYCLLKLKDAVQEQMTEPTDIKLRGLQALVSFMYLNCDIGRRK